MSNGPGEAILMHVAGFVLLIMATVIYAYGLPLEQRVFTIGVPAIILGAWLLGLHRFAVQDRSIRAVAVILLGAGLTTFSGSFVVGAWTSFAATEWRDGLANAGLALGLLGSVLLVTRRPREIWARKAGRIMVALGGLLALPFAIAAI